MMDVFYDFVVVKKYGCCILGIPEEQSRNHGEDTWEGISYGRGIRIP
ncbi:hypothetical protein [Pasteuria penetrans]|nr:hypothetical protein [Pasteuria penetrans]